MQWNYKRYPQAASMGDCVNNLQIGAKALAGFTHKRMLHGCEVKSDCWRSSGITSGLTHRRFCCSGRARNIVPSHHRHGAISNYPVSLRIQVACRLN